MENKPKLGLKNQQCRRLSLPKFKAINMEGNELQSKYDIYKNGTPNIYQQNVAALKTHLIKNDIKTIQLPALDYLLQDIKNTPINPGANHRDYNIHPSMIQKYGNKFRTYISDQQEIKDFLTWFSKKQKEITSWNCSLSQKFALNQSLLASGFNQMLTQISCVSKPRSEIIRMIWNKQNLQVQNIVNLLHKQNSSQEKNNLESVKSLHLGYQQQIIQLKNQSYCTEKKLQEATLLNEACLNSLRMIRKQIKKYEKIIKQLSESNNSLKFESINLLEENTRFLMRQNGITPQQARILAYRSLQLSKMKKNFNRLKICKNIFKEIKGKAQNIVQNNDYLDFEDGKEKLIDFIKKRVKKNPTQKCYILKGQFSDEEEEDVVLEKKIEENLQIKQVKAYLDQKYLKQTNIFLQKGVNTSAYTSEVKSLEKSETSTIGIQTVDDSMPKQNINKKLFSKNEKQEMEGLKRLKEKKNQQRHSLMMIEISKMMEFKKIDNANKIRKLSKFSTSSPPLNLSSVGLTSSAHSRQESQASISQESDSSQSYDQQIVMSKNKHQYEPKNKQNRQKNILKMHQQSFISQKSPDFQRMVKNIARESIFKLAQFPSEQKLQEQITIENELNKYQKIDSKVNDFKEVIRKYLKNNNHIVMKANPQKYLKKILTQTYKNLFLTKKANFLEEMIRCAKNIYGEVLYESKLLELIAMMIENKEKSLLSALNILLDIEEQHPVYKGILHQDTSQIYFKIYFYLSLKSPTENQFNIWGNYTNINQLSNTDFNKILGLYFSESKCMYLQLKIREFMGISVSQMIDGNYYVQLNPLMMYLLEVYLLEKQNYYESYHQMIDFLTEGEKLDLDTFLFLLDLLCLKENQQKQIIQAYFGQHNGFCDKDVFYRICVKYELPLFEFIKLLKLEQFKKLPQQIQNDYMDIDDTQKWSFVKQSLFRKLSCKAKEALRLQKILERLNSYIKKATKTQNQAFMFFYRVLIHTAHF